MGTRGFLGFVADGAEKIAYNHWDSYPEGLGTDVLAWLRAAMDDPDATARAARELRVVASSSVPSPEDIERLAAFADTTVGDQRADDWYCLLRKTQGDPSSILKAGVLVDASEFPSDSLFAEWGYVADFDAGVFEVYRGFQKEPHDKGRFASREAQPTSPSGTTYYPVALVASWPLKELPSSQEFLATLVPPDEDDE